MLRRSEPIAGLTPPRPYVAAAVAAALIAALVATIPFARVTITGSEVILPAYAAAVFVLEVITAALLFSLYSVQRGPALLVLASGYLTAALMIPGWILTFPGLFSSLGIEADVQATATIAALRRITFALFIFSYALAPFGASAGRSPGVTATWTVICIFAAAAAVMWLIARQQMSLPTFMRDARNVTALWSIVPAAAMAIYVTSMAILIRRRRAALDIWVCLVVFSLVIELTLLSYISSGVRLSVGWWGGRVYGLAAAGTVLLVLLADTTAVYARLARSVAAEQRARQNRLTAMEALSASIAHEINQPLASIITNADAGLRWLTRAEPRIDKVDASLRAIVSEGHRANKIVLGIRTMFMKGAQERALVDLPKVITDVTRSAAEEANLAGVSISVLLDPQTPAVIGNSVQLRQVIRNLVENAIDAMKTISDRQRELSIETRRLADGEVEITVRDTGTGLEPGMEERVFEPFFSSKPGGMGMGLMFCRAVVEAHGGRLWTSANVPRGAIFHVSLPAAEMNSRD
ncbi:MASE4 domain-containing protein [Muricoccus roseus]|uniref:MASE4 domain-containing protein n=1 Tax=Muricoccus roseus TaxID=198092 RepID=UPI00093413F9|nr:ATP-binding protein [Roseomonas rosea]